jgi:Skp family chaperone for outer membrane proteins
MRRTLALLALPLATSLMAQETSSPRIAFFIPGQVIGSSVRAKKVLAELDVTTNNLNEKLKARMEELQKLDQQLKSSGLSEEGRAKIQRDLQDGEIKFRRLQEDSQTELRKVQDKCLGQFQQEVRPLTDALAKEWKVQVVFNYQEGMLMWAEEDTLTLFSAEIAKRYDAKYEGTSAGSDKPATTNLSVTKPAAKKK